MLLQVYLIVSEIPAKRINYIVQRTRHAYQTTVPLNMGEYRVLVVAQLVRPNFDFNGPKDAKYPALARGISRT